MRIAEVKKDIARVKTIIREQQLMRPIRGGIEDGKQNFFPADQSRPGGFRTRWIRPSWSPSPTRVAHPLYKKIVKRTYKLRR